MSDLEKLDAALSFAKKKHEGQKRIGGDDYITHPVAVCDIVKSQGYDTSYQITALFHDLLEDTDTTEDDILMYGSPEILEAVKLLTKENGYVMSDYVAKIKENKIARVVKAADRLHNLRCAVVASQEFRRKYILETVDWYLDFSSEIQEAVKTLARSLDTPLPEMSFLYEPVETWKI